MFVPTQSSSLRKFSFRSVRLQLKRAGTQGAGMKKSLSGQQSCERRPEIDAVLDEDLGTFLRILTNLSGTLRDLGYPEEGEMLIGVKTDILQRLRDTIALAN